MSTANAHPEPVVEHRRGPSLLAHKWFLFALIFLSTIGIYVTDSFPARGYTYWMAMGPVFCAFNLFTAWSRNRQSGATMSGIVGTMLLHWAGFLAAVYVLFMLYSAGHIDAKVTGMVTLLALALTTFLAGVHFDWRLCLIGALLAAVVAGEALVQRFLWMAVLPLAAATALVVYWWLRRGRPDEPRS
jgi:hypothetical protein